MMGSFEAENGMAMEGVDRIEPRGRRSGKGVSQISRGFPWMKVMKLMFQQIGTACALVEDIYWWRIRIQ